MAPSAHLPSGTKRDILKLLIRQELSADSLARTLAVSPAAVRQHLDTLQALELVNRRKNEARRSSRPTFLYRLSEQGAAIFPKRYDLLLGLVVDVLLERSGATAVEEVIRAAAERLAERGRTRLRRSDGAGRSKEIVEWLEAELAWQADLTTDGTGRRITIHQCPFQDVAREHPSVCGVFFTTLLRALEGGAEVEPAPTPPAPACCAFVLGA
jgi:DeoR family transcriptional regulator, suf operon transcriptional repressor